MGNGRFCSTVVILCGSCGEEYEKIEMNSMMLKIAEAMRYREHDGNDGNDGNDDIMFVSFSQTKCTVKLRRERLDVASGFGMKMLQCTK